MFQKSIEQAAAGIAKYAAKEIELTAHKKVKIADVAINVAIVMPLMGLAELPIRPTIRELTVTKRKPKTTISSEAARFCSSVTCAPGTGLK